MFFFFFNDTATTEIYTLSLHDALPISAAPPSWPRSSRSSPGRRPRTGGRARPSGTPRGSRRDRERTRLNSSHANISYAGFCLKKKKKLLLGSRWAGHKLSDE